MGSLRRVLRMMLLSLLENRSFGLWNRTEISQIILVNVFEVYLMMELEHSGRISVFGTLAAIRNMGMHGSPS